MGRRQRNRPRGAPRASAPDNGRAQGRDTAPSDPRANAEDTRGGEGRDTAAPPKQEVYPPFVDDSDEGRFRFDAAVRLAAHVMGEPPESKTTVFAAQRLYHSGIET